MNAGTTADIDFSTTNWNTTQAVTVTAVNDSDQDDETATLTFSTVNASTSADYDNVVNVTRTVNVDDNDGPPNILTSAVSRSATEAGGTATFTVVLNSEPTANVTIAVSSGDPTEGTVLPASLTFTSGNWNTSKPVTVTGKDDDVDDGDVDYNIILAASSTDNGYNNRNVNVLVTTTDDDVAAVTVDTNLTMPGAQATTLSVTEGATTATFTVQLATEPTAAVTVAVASQDTSEGTATPAALTFTATDWHTAQSVTVTGADDNLVDGDETWAVRVTPSSSDLKYNTPLLSYVDVAVTTTDDDVAAVTVDTNLTMPGAQATTLSVTEGATTATFTVQLATEPTAAVTVTVASQDTSEGTATPAALTFTATDWHTAQPVTVTGADDDVADRDETWAVRVTPSSGDSNYNTPSLSVDVAVTTTDDDTPAVMVDTNLTMPGAQATTLSVTEGATTATFTVQLATQPTAAVTVAVESQNTGEGTATPAALTFTATDWHTAQPVTVTGADDNVADGAKPWAVRVTPSSDDSNYNTPSLSVDVWVTTTEDDTPGLMIAPTALALEEATTNPATHMQTYTVKLASKPTAAVTVMVRVTVANGHLDAVMVAPTTLTFTAADWDTAQPVTVTADEGEDDYEHETVTLTHTASTASGDSEYDTLPAAERPSVTVTVTDKDMPPPLGAGTNMARYNGVEVTLRAPDAPGVTVTPPHTVSGAGLQAIEIEIALEPDPPAVAADGSVQGLALFSLGPAGARTVFEITVQLPDSDTALTAAQLAALLPGEGIKICLPSAALQAEAEKVGEMLKFLHYQDGAWRVEPPVDGPPDKVCARLKTFSPMALAFKNLKPTFPKEHKGLKKEYPTGQAVTEGEGALPRAAGGDLPLRYRLEPPALPAGLT